MINILKAFWKNIEYSLNYVMLKSRLKFAKIRIHKTGGGLYLDQSNSRTRGFTQEPIRACCVDVSGRFLSNRFVLEIFQFKVGVADSHFSLFDLKLMLVRFTRQKWLCLLLNACETLWWVCMRVCACF